MNAFWTLMKREYWEHRGAFFWTPTIIGSVLIIFLIMGLIMGAYFVNKVDGEQFVISELIAQLNTADPGQRREIWRSGLLSVAVLFNIVLFFVLFFYYLGSLYDDRKDRSYLFWKSMPVSDLQTVLSKLAAGSLLAPAITIAVTLVTFCFILFIISFVGLFSGLEVWSAVWAPANPFGMVLFLVCAYLLNAIWMLPVYGWLLLTSAWAKSKAFLVAVVPPVVLIIMDSYFSFMQYFELGSVWRIVLSRLFGGFVPLNVSGDGSPIGINIDVERANQALVAGEDVIVETAWNVLGARIIDIDFWLGAVVGIMFIAGAVYIRRYRDPD